MTFDAREAMKSASLAPSSSMSVEEANERDILEATAHAGASGSEASLFVDRHSTPSQASASNSVNTTQPPLSCLVPLCSCETSTSHFRHKPRKVILRLELPKNLLGCLLDRRPFSVFSRNYEQPPETTSNPVPVPWASMDHSVDMSSWHTSTP